MSGGEGEDPVWVLFLCTSGFSACQGGKLEQDLYRLGYEIMEGRGSTSGGGEGGLVVVLMVHVCEAQSGSLGNLIRLHVGGKEKVKKKKQYSLPDGKEDR